MTAESDPSQWYDLSTVLFLFTTLPKEDVLALDIKLFPGEKCC
jgi:hypothetical protein